MFSLHHWTHTHTLSCGDKCKMTVRHSSPEGVCVCEVNKASCICIYLHFVAYFSCCCVSVWVRMWHLIICIHCEALWGDGRNNNTWQCYILITKALQRGVDLTVVILSILCSCISAVCVFFREMVDIECFLRETAEKEVEAKSRLQVTPEDLVFLPLLKGQFGFWGILQIFLISENETNRFFYAFVWC